MKKSLSEEQVLNLNRIDFEKAGTNRKAGYKFTIQFRDGKVGNVISGSALASQLAQEILEDDSASKLLQSDNFEIHLNTKFQLTILHVPK